MRGKKDIQALAFLDEKHYSFFEIEGSFTDGETETHTLEDNEIIVGAYGIYNY